MSEKPAYEALEKQSQEFFTLITGHTRALVSIHDSSGHYIYASPSYEQLGYKPADLIGQSGFKMMEKEDIEASLQYLKKAGKGEISGTILNFRLKHKDGGTFFFRGSFDPVFKPDGTLEKIICVAQDITELQKAQKAKIEALTLAAETQKLALVGQITGKMAHDFNNILGVIMGNVELCLLDHPNDKTRKTLELILAQTLRGKNLTKNLVAFAGDQDPRQVFFSIDEKIELIISLLKKDLEGILLIRNYDEKIPEVLADSGMIEHALVNLIHNSIHAVSLSSQPEIIIRTYQREGKIFIGIQDNGCGIPEAYLEKIFEPAFSLKGSKDIDGMYKPGIKGTGYGLSNVKKYVERNKGTISVRSEFQKGTTVTIALPVAKDIMTKEKLEAVKKDCIICGKHILVVEDEPAISDVQCRVLSNDPCRHKVDIADNGQTALDLLSKNEYDLISLDYILPGNLNGMDVYHHVRETNKTVPVLFISGNIEFLESIKELKQKDPYIEHLSKPCKNANYLNSLNNLLGRCDT